MSNSTIPYHDAIIAGSVAGAVLLVIFVLVCCGRPSRNKNSPMDDCLDGYFFGVCVSGCIDAASQAA